MFQQTVDILVLASLVATAIAVVRMRTLIGAAMLMGIYSFLSASWMLILDAPDVAFTEAAVGAGVSTIFVLVTLSLTTVRAKRPKKLQLVPLAVVVLTGAVLIYGTLDMPLFEDPAAPVHRVGALYLEQAPEAVGVPNIVTAVLASYRGYDTLGETIVVLTAGLAVLCLLRRRREDDEPNVETASS